MDYNIHNIRKVNIYIFYFVLYEIQITMIYNTLWLCTQNNFYEFLNETLQKLEKWPNIYKGNDQQL